MTRSAVSSRANWSGSDIIKSKARNIFPIFIVNYGHWGDLIEVTFEGGCCWLTNQSVEEVVGWLDNETSFEANASIRYLEMFTRGIIIDWKIWFPRFFPCLAPRISSISSRQPADSHKLSKKQLQSIEMKAPRVVNKKETKKRSAMLPTKTCQTSTKGKTPSRKGKEQMANIVFEKAKASHYKPRKSGKTKETVCSRWNIRKLLCVPR